MLAAPDDPAANLALARAAEERGAFRHAMAAYERVARAQPDNDAARRGFERMRNRLTPARTNVTVSAGATFYADAPRIDRPFDDVTDGSADFAVSVDDLRLAHGLRWRTIANAAASRHARFDDLSRFRAGVWTGPVVALSPRADLHLAAGGGVDWLFQRAVFLEGSARFELSTLLGGVPQKIAVKVGQRGAVDTRRLEPGGALAVYGISDYDEEAFVAEAKAVLTAWDLLTEGDALHFQPRARLSETGFGRAGESDSEFWEYGGLLTYYRPLFGPQTDIGVGFGVYDRRFNELSSSSIPLFNFLTTPAREERRDQLLEAHLHYVGRNLLSENTDLQIDYRFERNLSNDQDDDYANHVIGARIVWRR